MNFQVRKNSICCRVCHEEKGDFVYAECECCGAINVVHLVCIMFIRECGHCNRAFSKELLKKFDEGHIAFCNRWRLYLKKVEPQQRKIEAKREDARIEMQKTIDDKIKPVLEKQALDAYIQQYAWFQQQQQKRRQQNR